jgi:osmotically-inducible protein OsmY
MKAFLAFILGIVLGVLIQRFVIPPRANTLTNAPLSDTNAPAASAVKFDSVKIKEELSRTGQVIREKAREAGAAIADATANARITATIKGKFIREPNLSAFKINIDTTDGVVTLSGTVTSPEEVGHAMKIALETEGVYKVVSSLQVKP